jgi:hypothetical protein
MDEAGRPAVTYRRSAASRACRRPRGPSGRHPLGPGSGPAQPGPTRLSRATRRAGLALLWSGDNAGAEAQARAPAPASPQPDTGVGYPGDRSSGRLSTAPRETWGPLLRTGRRGREGRPGVFFLKQRVFGAHRPLCISEACRKC